MVRPCGWAGWMKAIPMPFPRAIVMHAAAYSTPDHVARWGRLGRSNGCFAFGPEVFPQALTRLMGGRLIFADRLGIAADGATVTAPPQATVDFQAIADENNAREAGAQAVREAQLDSEVSPEEFDDSFVMPNP